MGRLGFLVANRLTEAGHKIVGIEKDERVVEEVKDAGFLVIRADATEENSLLQAGVKRASKLVALLPSEADNLFITLSARELNPNLYILSRADTALGSKRIEKAGANHVVSLHQLAGSRLVENLTRPHVTDIMSLSVSKINLDLLIEEIQLSQNSSLAGKTLLELDIRKKTNITILAIIKKDGSHIINPPPSTVITAGSTLVAIGTQRDFEAFENCFAPI
ncbi:MAG: TrkA family potassium uptake protein [Candidatus Dadabacteria bacterium]|nr:MAG: TrkA family potassium uptake protein [Candidatus Dadabacteria bacterium]